MEAVISCTPFYDEVTMLKTSIALAFITLVATPAYGFEVYDGNLKVFEKNTGIQYHRYNVPKEQCLRSRYGRTDSAWPCKIDRRYAPKDVQAERLYIYTTPYRDKLYSPGMARLIETKP